MTEQEIHEDNLYDLEFAVCRSIRYHNKRKRFFELLNDYALFFSFITGSAAFVGLFADFPPVLLKLLVAIGVMLSLLNMIVGFSQKGRASDELQRRFCDLLIRIQKTEQQDGELRTLKAARSGIEKDEPPILRVLDIVCHNEEAFARGDRDNLYKVGFWYLLFRHVYAFDGWCPVEKKTTAKT